MKRKLKSMIFLKEIYFPNSDFSAVEEKKQPVVTFHKHDYGEIAFVLGGTGVHVTDTEKYSLMRGDVFVINGDKAHGFTNLKDLHIFNILYSYKQFNLLKKELKKLKGFNILFADQPSQRNFKGFNSKFRLNNKQLRKISILLKLFNEECSYNFPLNNVVVKILFEMIIIQICRDYSHSDVPETDVLSEIKKASDYIKENFVRPINLIELTEMTKMTIPVFRKNFKEITGFTPINLVIHMRIAEATRLLIEEKLKIKEVAIKVGFNNQSYFVRTFKKEIGVTPKQYMKKNS